MEDHKKQQQLHINQLKKNQPIRKTDEYQKKRQNNPNNQKNQKKHFSNWNAQHNKEYYPQNQKNQRNQVNKHTANKKKGIAWKKPTYYPTHKKHKGKLHRRTKQQNHSKRRNHFQNKWLNKSKNTRRYKNSPRYRRYKGHKKALKKQMHNSPHTFAWWNKRWRKQILNWFRICFWKNKQWNKQLQKNFSSRYWRRKKKLRFTIFQKWSRKKIYLRNYVFFIRKQHFKKKKYIIRKISNHNRRINQIFPKFLITTTKNLTLRYRLFKNSSVHVTVPPIKRTVWLHSFFKKCVKIRKKTQINTLCTPKHKYRLANKLVRKKLRLLLCKLKREKKKKLKLTQHFNSKTICYGLIKIKHKRKLKFLRLKKKQARKNQKRLGKQRIDIKNLGKQRTNLSTAIKNPQQKVFIKFKKTAKVKQNLIFRYKYKGLKFKIRHRLSRISKKRRKQVKIKIKRVIKFLKKTKKLIRKQRQRRSISRHFRSKPRKALRFKYNTRIKQIKSKNKIKIKRKKNLKSKLIKTKRPLIKNKKRKQKKRVIIKRKTLLKKVHGTLQKYINSYDHKEYIYWRKLGLNKFTSKYVKRRRRKTNFTQRRKKNRFISLNPRYWVSRFRFRFSKTKKGRRLRKKRYTRVGEYHKYPWLNPILYKRQLYRGTQRNIYMRLRMPSFHKRNRIYFRFKNFLYHRWNRGVRGRDYFRIKNILHKLILSFYGHIKLKQFKHIVKIHRSYKPAYRSKISLLLNKFERRLDVTAYRLNFAPTVQWARELIRIGTVSVDSEIIQKPQFLVPNFAVVQFSCPRLVREKFKKLFAKKLFKKPIPNHLMSSAKLAAGLFLRAPTPKDIPVNDRATFLHFNVVRLINSIALTSNKLNY